MEDVKEPDGIHAMVPREAMSPGAAKLRDFYCGKPGAPIVQGEFGFYCLERWRREGHIPDGADLNALFGFDEPGGHSLYGLGWCEAAFRPSSRRSQSRTAGTMKS